MAVPVPLFMKIVTGEFGCQVIVGSEGGAQKLVIGGVKMVEKDQVEKEEEKSEKEEEKGDEMEVDKNESVQEDETMEDGSFTCKWRDCSEKFDNLEEDESVLLEHVLEKHMKQNKNQENLCNVREILQTFDEIEDMP